MRGIIRGKTANAGFTLVEMLIAAAVLSVVVTLVSVIVSVSGNSYRSISADLNLQYESQVAMSQIEELIVDCNAYIGAGRSGLYVFNREDDGSVMAYRVAKSGSEIYLYSKSIEGGFDPAGAENYVFDGGQPMSSHVAEFTAAVEPGGGGPAGSVEIEISYESVGKTFSARQVVALRNSVEDISAFVPQG